MSLSILTRRWLDWDNIITYGQNKEGDCFGRFQHFLEYFENTVRRQILRIQSVLLHRNDDATLIIECCIYLLPMLLHLPIAFPPTLWPL